MSCAAPAGRRVKTIERGYVMLYWAVVFLIIALIAGGLGFTGVAFVSADMARILFIVFLVLFLISLVAHAGRRI
jgi:uncharacterized membrane protein YtjA (UPF0391 family)